MQIIGRKIRNILTIHKTPQPKTDIRHRQVVKNRKEEGQACNKLNQSKKQRYSILQNI